LLWSPVSGSLRVSESIRPAGSNPGMRLADPQQPLGLQAIYCREGYQKSHAVRSTVGVQTRLVRIGKGEDHSPPQIP